MRSLRYVASVLVTVGLVTGLMSLPADARRGPRPVPSGISTTAPAPAQAAGFTRLSFRDEFSSMSTIDVSGTGAPGYQWYTDRPFGWGRTPAADLSTSNGILTISPSTASPNYSIATSSPTSRSGKGFRYGYFEARMAFDPRKAAGSAGWPSFWGVSHAQVTGAGMPRSMELDFFEAYHAPYQPHEDVFSGTVHDWIIGPPQLDRANYGNNGKSMSGFDWQNFHTYGCLWQPGKITWYLDGQAQFSQQYSADAPPVPNTAGLASGVFSPLDTDLSGQTVILGSGVGYPMSVDWVRVWQG